MKSRILKLRKKIFNNLKSKAFSYEEENTELTNYLAEQTNAAKRKFNISNIEDLSSAVLNSQVIYLGDFHTFDQNIRNVLRIVRYILSVEDEITLGLEMVSKDHQLYIDAYVEGHLTDLEFLECINYSHSWRFPWTHYKLIFELAKKHKLKVLGLNTKGSLIERDKYAADVIHKTLKECDTSKMLVLYGELHITPTKIPRLLKEKLPEIKSTIIHQNLDEVYWKLIQQEHEQGIVKFNDDEYCIISAPPWIKYESMIYWYENLSDDPDFDIHEYIIEKGAKIFNEDTNDNFLNISLEIINHLHLTEIIEDIEDFNLYDHTNLEYIEERLERNLSPGLFKFYQGLITKNKSFRLPDSNTYYCSSYSMNRISYLSGINILHIFLEKNKVDTYSILKSRSNIKKFLLFTYESMFAYLISKIINPHRKCEMYNDILDNYNKDPNKRGEIVLNFFNNDPLGETLKSQKLIDIYSSALDIGHILGEYFYIKLNSKTSSIKLKKILLNIDLSPAQFEFNSNQILKDFQFREHNKRYF